MTKSQQQSKSKARILVVDDHPVVREGLVALINRRPDLICCGQAGTGAETLAVVSRERPDLVLLDLRLKGEDGLELIKNLKSMSPDLRILVLSENEAPSYVERALRAGAQGYLAKDQAPEDVLGAIATVMAGQVFLNRSTAALMLHKLVGSSAWKSGTSVERLSDRELHVLELLGTGMSTREVAAELRLSIKTIETHRENIKRKLGLRGAAQLLHFATEWAREQIALPPEAFLGQSKNPSKSAGASPSR